MSRDQLQGKVHASFSNTKPYVAPSFLQLLERQQNGIRTIPLSVYLGFNVGVRNRFRL